jgi:chromosome segregation ATPase
MNMRAPRGWTWIAAGLVLSGLGLPAWTQDEAIRQRLAAMAGQGDLLLQEATALQPRTRELERRGAELAGEGKRLQADVAAVEGAVREYNAEVGAAGLAADAQRERCTGVSLDAQRVAACNEEGAAISAQGAALEQRREPLAERQQTLNQSIDRYNARRAEWEQARRQHDRRRTANESEVRQWLERARELSVSDGFAAVSRAAGTPAACSSSRLAGADAAHPVEALKRMQSCLRAVAR